MKLQNLGIEVSLRFANAESLDHVLSELNRALSAVSGVEVKGFMVIMGLSKKAEPIEPDPILDKRVNEVIPPSFLTLRASTCISRLGIVTIRDLVGKTREDFLILYNVGKKTVDEIEGQLSKIGLGLRKDE